MASTETPYWYLRSWKKRKEEAYHGISGTRWRRAAGPWGPPVARSRSRSASNWSWPPSRPPASWGTGARCGSPADRSAAPAPWRQKTKEQPVHALKIGSEDRPIDDEATEMSNVAWERRAGAGGVVTIQWRCGLPWTFAYIYIYIYRSFGERKRREERDVGSLRFRSASDTRWRRLHKRSKLSDKYGMWQLGLIWRTPWALEKAYVCAAMRPHGLDDRTIIEWKL